MNGVWSSVISPTSAGRERRGGAGALGGRAQARPQLRVRARLARDPHRALLGDEVEQHERADLVARGARRRPSSRAAPVASNGCVSSVASSPSKNTKRISGAPLGRFGLAQRARDLEHRGGAARAVVGADEARAGPWCRSARRARPRACAPGMRPTTLRRPGWPGHRLVVPAREPLAQVARRASRAAASRPGAGRAPTWCFRCFQRARGVEAVRALGGDGRGRRGRALGLRAAARGEREHERDDDRRRARRSWR